MNNNKQYIYLYGTKWYFRLLPKKTEDGKGKIGLFTDHPRNTLNKSLIICLSYYDNKTHKELRLFSFFKSYLEYGIYHSKIPSEERCFYEIILGENNQKPHFDVDIEILPNETMNGDEIRDNLVNAIIEVLKEKGVSINLNRDILIYTSHGNNKQSYHVIVDNYCHVNNIEAKAFYYKVTEHMKPEYAKWVDSAVYNSLQQFRTSESRKIGTTRVKNFQSSWVYYNKEIKYEYPEVPDSPEHAFVMQLEASIVGYTGNCKFLPPFEPRPDQIKHYQTELDDVTQADAQDAIQLIATAGNIKTSDSRFPYKFLGINGPIVMLKRTKPSKCKICERIHEHENPYLVVIGEEKSVYFHCRRAPNNKNLFLGKLNPRLEDSSPEVKDIKEDEVKLDRVKINWTKNVIDRIQQVAKTGNPNDKKFITSETPIDKIHKRQLIDMYINYK